MKFLNKSIYALSLVGMMGLWSCSQEEMMQGGDVTVKGHSVPVTLTVSRGDTQTRTVLSENTATGGLNDLWEQGDKLAVYNSEGLKAGELEITEGEGTDTGVFTGIVTAENGLHDFNLWYTDPKATGETDADGKPIYFNSKKEIVVDLSKMPKYTSVEVLSAMDVLSKKVSLNINGNQATVAKSETMNAHLAMARFSLDGIPTDKTGKLTIRNYTSTEVTGGNKAIVYKERLGLADSENKGTAERPEGIVVENVKGGEDIYLAFIPGTYTLSFHVECEGINYDYSFTNSTELKAGVYYNAFTKAEGAEEGTIDGVNIPLQKEILAELHIYAAFDGANPEKIIEYKPFVIDNGSPKAEFKLEDYDYYVTNYGLPAVPSGYTFKGWSYDDPRETSGSYDVDVSAVTLSSYTHNKESVYAVWEISTVDHSKNPLKKWAEGNLQHLSSTDGATSQSEVLSNGYAVGSHYQWGRNKGYNSIAEAKGKFDNSVKKYSYYITNYDTSGNTKYGEGGMSVCLDSRSLVVNPGPLQATSSEKHPEAWYMNAADNGGSGDYMSGSDKDWATRAKACGYTYGSPCPEGYRLPTSSDFAQIMPSEYIEVKNKNNLPKYSLASQLSSLQEIKKFNIGEAEYSYAIKWRIEDSVLKISALMVPNDLDESELTESYWNKNEENIVERIFPFGGVFRSTRYRFTSTASYSYTFTEYATILPLGDIRFDWKKFTYSGYSFGYSKYSIYRDHSNKAAGYWVSDSKQTFYLIDSYGWVAGAANPTTGAYLGYDEYPQSTQFKMMTQNAHNGYCIRCIDTTIENEQNGKSK